MEWGLVGFVLMVAAMGLFPRWHWWQQLGLALGSGTLTVVAYYLVLGLGS